MKGRRASFNLQKLVEIHSPKEADMKKNLLTLH